MTQLIIVTRPEPHWPDLAAKLGTPRLIHLGHDAPPIQVAALPGGMSRGAPSVAFRFDLPDGRTVLAETSLKLLVAAATILNTRYGPVDIGDLTAILNPSSGTSSGAGQ